MRSEDEGDFSLKRQLADGSWVSLDVSVTAICWTIQRALATEEIDVAVRQN